MEDNLKKMKVEDDLIFVVEKDEDEPIKQNRPN
jgi:hypothetical protein